MARKAQTMAMSSSLPSEGVPSTGTVPSSASAPSDDDVAAGLTPWICSRILVKASDEGFEALNQLLTQLREAFALGPCLILG